MSFITADNTAGCGVELELGEEYLVGLDEDNMGHLTASSCGLFRLWSDVTEGEESLLEVGCVDACDGNCSENTQVCATPQELTPLLDPLSHCSTTEYLIECHRLHCVFREKRTNLATACSSIAEFMTDFNHPPVDQEYAHVTHIGQRFIRLLHVLANPWGFSLAETLASLLDFFAAGLPCFPVS